MTDDDEQLAINDVIFFLFVTSFVIASEYIIFFALSHITHLHCLHFHVRAISESLASISSNILHKASDKTVNIISTRDTIIIVEISCLTWKMAPRATPATLPTQA